MRKILTFAIITIFIYTVISYKNFDAFKEIQKFYSNFLFFEKKIKKISIINNKNTSTNYLLRLLNLEDKEVLTNFNRNKLRRKLDGINEIENYNFELNENGHLIIQITEKRPFMIWVRNGKQNYIDDKGGILKFSKVDNLDLIKIFGEKPLINFSQVMKQLKRRKDFLNSIKQILIKNDDDWLFVLNDGKCVSVLTKKLDKVLNIFENIKKLKFYNKFSFFDMRIYERIYLSNKPCLI